MFAEKARAYPRVNHISDAPLKGRLGWKGFVMPNVVVPLFTTIRSLRR